MLAFIFVRDQGSIPNPIPDLGLCFRSGVFKKSPSIEKGSNFVIPSLEYTFSLLNELKQYFSFRKHRFLFNKINTHSFRYLKI